MPAEAVPYGRITQKPSPVSDVHILWITAGLGCDGDSVSITAVISSRALDRWDLCRSSFRTDCRRRPSSDRSSLALR